MEPIFEMGAAPFSTSRNRRASDNLPISQSKVKSECSVDAPWCSPSRTTEAGINALASEIDSPGEFSAGDETSYQRKR